jgi:hypothetical protein
MNSTKISSLSKIYENKKTIYNFHNLPQRVNDSLSLSNKTVFFDCSFENCLFYLFKPLFFKYFFSKVDANFSLIYEKTTFFIKNFFFYSKKNKILANNILPNSSFFWLIRKKVFKLFSYQKFSSAATPFYSNALIRFLENSTGKRVALKISPTLNNVLDLPEKAQCAAWALKLRNFRKILGPRLYLSESLEILYIAFKLKDAYFLSN